MLASLATSFRDMSLNEIRLWSIDGQLLGPISLPEMCVDLAFAPDGSSLLALGQSGGLYRVNLHIQDWIDIARRIAGRDFSDQEKTRYAIDAWRVRANT